MIRIKNCNDLLKYLAECDESEYGGIVDAVNTHFAIKRGDMIQTSWCIDDVLSQPLAKRMRLTRKDARDVLAYCEKRHDASIGINWDVIDCFISEVANEKPLH